MTTAGEGRVSDELICVIITAGKGDDHSEDVRVGNDQICMIITVKVTVWAMKMDLCDHHSGERR